MNQPQDYELEQQAFNNGYRTGAEHALEVMTKRLLDYIASMGFSQIVLARLRDEVKATVLAQCLKSNDDE